MKLLTGEYAHCTACNVCMLNITNIAIISLINLYKYLEITFIQRSRFHRRLLEEQQKRQMTDITRHNPQSHMNTLDVKSVLCLLLGHTGSNLRQ